MVRKGNILSSQAMIHALFTCTINHSVVNMVTEVFFLFFLQTYKKLNENK